MADICHRESLQFDMFSADVKPEPHLDTVAGVKGMSEENSVSMSTHK